MIVDVASGKVVERREVPAGTAVMAVSRRTVALSGPERSRLWTVGRDLEPIEFNQSDAIVGLSPSHVVMGQMGGPTKVYKRNGELVSEVGVLTSWDVDPELNRMVGVSEDGMVIEVDLTSGRAGRRSVDFPPVSARFTKDGSVMILSDGAVSGDAEEARREPQTVAVCDPAAECETRRIEVVPMLPNGPLGQVVAGLE